MPVLVFIAVIITGLVVCGLGAFLLSSVGNFEVVVIFSNLYTAAVVATCSYLLLRNKKK